MEGSCKNYIAWPPALMQRGLDGSALVGSSGEDYLGRTIVVAWRYTAFLAGFSPVIHDVMYCHLFTEIIGMGIWVVGRFVLIDFVTTI